ncbi:MAG TPA: hypothetical protein PLZ93_03885 [Nocardioides sp.]|nr:hypothetical protein [Nocardioides sp.]HRK44623.1 hypothetical protein [Nocardioides sp.]
MGRDPERVVVSDARASVDDGAKRLSGDVESLCVAEAEELDHLCDCHDDLFGWSEHRAHEIVDGNSRRHRCRLIMPLLDQEAAAGEVQAEEGDAGAESHRLEVVVSDLVQVVTIRFTGRAATTGNDTLVAVGLLVGFVVVGGAVDRDLIERLPIDGLLDLNGERREVEKPVDAAPHGHRIRVQL